MGLYSLGVQIDPGANLVGLREAFEIRTGERQAALFELTYINGAAATPGLTLGRTSIVGTGGTQFTFTPDNPSDPAATTFAFAGTWSRVPIDTGIHMRRYLYASGNQGGAIMWTWRNGLIIPPYSSVAIWNNISTDPAVADVSLVIEE
jgi:hypothetical protein